ncbi:histone deacetylase family protein [Roseomonas hellenica]|uniref:Histone deacetylase family protein n=1 Tax=Plastoroseomonas hellenica TaxID=2687306 RepID=A0ABS5ESZ6_9PROT|nr:histone deacetylase family protein [Plastoroseomonas hellenica]MBR0663409.1 histone deacetylase family protein [Plastoroseomonas hellenica]
MKTFHAPGHARHAPGFFLMRGQVRPNFEVPARAEALLAALHAMRLAPEVPPPAPLHPIAAVHDAAYLAFLESVHALWSAMPQAGPEAVANIHPSPEMLAQGARAGAGLVSQIGWYTADTACPIGPGTWSASLDAAACALAAAAEAAAGRAAYALCRPPGHHAYAARAGGHCYLNNAAIAVEALKRAGAARVAVLDIDSHHGNGTQGIFWDRGDVLTVSIHGDPNHYYPWYVGHAEERGTGAGDGFNLNLPLAIGSADAPWLEAIATGIARIHAFAPDALVLSLGFDASVHEPLNALSVSDDGFARAGAAAGALRLPSAIIQEGGYAVDHLGALLTRFLTGFQEATR